MWKSFQARRKALSQLVNGGCYLEVKEEITVHTFVGLIKDENT